MTSRLDTLLRQRELLREHAQWLDDEIAAERARTGTPARELEIAPTAPAAQKDEPEPTTSLPTAVLSEPDVKGLHSQVRQGCMLYFLIAAAAFAGLVAFIYWKYQPDKETELTPSPVEAPAPPASGESR